MEDRENDSGCEGDHRVHSNSNAYDATDVLKLLEKMIQLGYLKDHHPIDHNPSNHENDHVIIITHHSDKSKACCMTRSYLKKEIIEKKLVDNGRLHLRALAIETHVHFDDIWSVAKELVSSCHALKYYYLVGDVPLEMVTDSYLNDLCTQSILLVPTDDVHNNKLDSYSDLDPQREMIYIFNLAKLWRLPLSFTMDVVSKRMHLLQNWKWVHCKVCATGGRGEGPFIITSRCQEWKLNEIHKILHQVKEPILITHIMDQVQYWDLNTVIGFVQTHIVDSDGTLHYCHSSPLSAFYRPQVYESQTRSIILNTFDSIGYIRYDYGEKYGFTKKRLEDLLDDKNPICLQGGVIHSNVVVSPLLLAIEECIESNTFTELSIYLPKGISDTDISELFEHYILPQTVGEDSQFGGKLIVQKNETVYFSQGMVEDVQKNILPSLISSTAKSVAQMFRDDRKQQRKNPKNETDDRSHLFPLSSLVKAILVKYPELSEIPSVNDNRNRLGLGLGWDDPGGDGSTLPSVSSIVTFCRSFYSTTLVDAFALAVQKSKLNLQTSRNVGSSYDSELSEESTTVSFEELFQEACYFLQLLAKLPQYVSSKIALMDKCVLKALYLDYFNGFASVFARLVTEYCLLKHNADFKRFPFASECKSEKATAYGRNMKLISARSFVSTFPICMKETHDENLPLLILKDLLPANAAMAVSKTWLLINSINAIQSDEEQDDIFNDGIHAFLAHAEESCLIMVGIPFKKLDKKMEKSLLSSRKKVLLSELEQSTSTNDILELSTILLGSQARNYVLCGKELTSNVLNVLLEDKKVNSDLRKLFRDVLNAAQKGRIGELEHVEDTFENAIALKLKNCALSKNMLLYKEDETICLE